MRRALLVFVSLLLVPRDVAAQGNPLGPEFQVNAYTTNGQSYAAVSADPSGNFVVVWRSDGQDGSVRGVFGRRFSVSGAPLGPEFRVNTYTTSYQQLPSVAAFAAGFVVAWESFQDGSLFGVYAQRYDSAGAPAGAEFRVNTYTTNPQGLASVAVDSTGRFVVVWASRDQDGSSDGIFGQRFDASGAALGAEFRVNSYTTGLQQFPSVAADPAGNFVVVWESVGPDGSGYGVLGQRYASSGAPLGSEFRVNSFTTGTQYAADVGYDASGNFVIAWSSAQDGSGFGVFGQRYASSGAPVGPEFQVNTYTTGVQFVPSLAVDASGNFVVVWMGDVQDGSAFGVFGQRYAGSGASLGPEFRVNTYTTSLQVSATVAAGTAGNFIVTWTSPQDGSSNGIYGQRYAQIVPVELMHFRVE
jgi:hypothetical protein